jgi:hypothetical protein
MSEVRGEAALGVVRTQAARRTGDLGLSIAALQSVLCGGRCRKRETPSSLRFLGRKVFFGRWWC